MSLTLKCYQVFL